MRLLFGIILGALLTIGGAYLYDQNNATRSMEASAPAARPMVNWDVVSTNWDRLTLSARHQWDRLRANIDEKRASAG